MKNFKLGLVSFAILGYAQPRLKIWWIIQHRKPASGNNQKADMALEIGFHIIKENLFKN